MVEGRARVTRIAGVVGSAAPAQVGLRLVGSGGLYGYLGWFRVDGERARAFVTDRRRAVVITVGGSQVAISPATSLDAGDA